MGKRIKTFLLAIFAFLCLASLSIAGTTNVTFQWDANTEPDISGYRLYQATTSGVYEYGSSSSNLIADVVHNPVEGLMETTVNGIADGTYFWVVTAYDTEGNESGPSNEVTETFDATAPGCPASLIIKFTEPSE